MIKKKRFGGVWIPRDNATAVYLFIFILIFLNPTDPEQLG